MYVACSNSYYMYVIMNVKNAVLDVMQSYPQHRTGYGQYQLRWGIK